MIKVVPSSCVGSKPGTGTNVFMLKRNYVDRQRKLKLGGTFERPTEIEIRLVGRQSGGKESIHINIKRTKSLRMLYLAVKDIIFEIL
jgi:hypothetical protein